jgi:formate hydrogenlyase subunit 3/multisubunit Na+/H+ antiporter MnhD subunit
MTLEMPWALLGLRFGLDETTRTFLGFTLLLWLLAALYAFGYVRARRRAFAAFFGATFAGNLGLVLAQDAAGFYFFFALMTFAAYGLVVHERTSAAWRAGRAYIVLAVIGEALLLGGLILSAASAQSLSLEHVRAGAAASGYRDAIVLLLFAGFGVKAGVLGLHMWLPLAHPVAPTPASAVLSGAMIKAGLLGWLQFMPLGEVAFPAAGAAIAALGIAAALLAAVAGVAQDDPKTVLAYSSVSQMGFMTVALAAALAIPSLAPAAIAAATLYALHHGLAKGALFLGAGISFRNPLLLAFLLLPALALAGLPYSSGAAAKHALKALLDHWPAAAALLSVAAAGTTLLMARFLYLLGTKSAKEKDGHRNHPLCLFAWLAGVGASVAALAAAPLPGFYLADLWPVLAGAALALAFAALGGRARRWRLPAGDVLVPLTLLAFTVARKLALAVRALEAKGRGAFVHLREREQGWVARFEQKVAAAEYGLRAHGLGAGLVVIALVLALSIL